MTNSEAVVKAQRRKKIKAVEEFGGRCQICGYKKCLNALTFHHRFDKQFSPSYLIMRHKWETVVKELKKCILVCANCHAEIHFEDRDVSYVAFNESEWVSRTCEYCSGAFTTRLSLQRFCSSRCASLGQHTKEKPSKDDLRKDLEDKMSYAGLSKKYKASANTVRKWAHSYGLDFFGWIENRRRVITPR